MTIRTIAPFAALCACAALAACGGGATVGSGGTVPIDGTTPISGGTVTASPAGNSTASPGGMPTAKATATATPMGVATATPSPAPSASGAAAASGSDQPADATTSEQTFGLQCAPEFTTTGGGYGSCNMKWIEHINLNGGESIGAGYVASTHTYYVTNFESGFYSFDTTNPAAPVLDQDLTVDLGNIAAGAQISAVENEETAVNDKLAILSRTGNRDAVVVDVSNPKAMKIASTVPGAFGHTMRCLLDCLYAYSSYSGSTYTGGHVIDLTNPAKPVMGADWSTTAGGIANIHDTTEIKPGLVALAGNPLTFLDTTNPVVPKVAFSLPMSAAEPEPGAMGPAQSGHVGHSVQWPRQGSDKFLLGQSEGIYVGLCNMFPHDGRTLYSYDTTGYPNNKNFTISGAYTLVNGTNDQGTAGGIEEVDSHGSPSTAVVGAPEGCSTHWFDVNQNFNNGGLVAMSSFAFGVRLLNVSSSGQIQQVGWFVPSGLADTVGVRWITDRIMYLIDFETGGIDVIEYTGPLPASGPMAIAPHRRA